MIDQLQALKAKALAEFDGIAEPAGLEEWRTRYIGRRGELTQLLRGLGGLTAAERPLVGQAANEIKAELEAALESRRSAAAEASRLDRIERDRIDVTLPGRPTRVGFEHIITKTTKDIADIFVALGFQIESGPEVEWDYYNFEALNIPKDHPARDQWDTLYVGDIGRPGETLLRTHTSPNQIRVMERTQPPVRVIVPGKCYRYEAVDATHEWMFHQVEGLAVDQRLTMADMKGTLTAFVHRIFGPERRLRLRCDFFPFVEPGAEVAIDCHLCGGAGCGLCKRTGWIEIMGAGMVHPKVLANVGYDPSIYSGFAFGMGVERIAMLKHGIDDIRLFYGNDLRFLRLFR